MLIEGKKKAPHEGLFSFNFVLCWALHLNGSLIDNTPFQVLYVAAVLTDKPSSTAKAIRVRSIVFGALASGASLHADLLSTFKTARLFLLS